MVIKSSKYFPNYFHLKGWGKRLGTDFMMKELISNVPMEPMAGPIVNESING